MLFNDHSRLSGKHAFLSASKHHWINYSDDKLVESFTNAMAAARGTELHDIAARLITQKIRLPRSRKTLNMYVNDAIGFRMLPEQVLRYSDNAFGTADTISFRDDLLRIHDLKTGVMPAKFEQLEIYTAFFCLEYMVRPGDIRVELRLYQNDSVLIHEPEVDKIAHIMDRVITFDKYIEGLKVEAML